MITWQYSWQICKWTDNQINHVTNEQINMPTFQVAMVLLYNDANEITISNIRRFTNLPDKEVVQHLKALVNYDILKCEQNITKVRFFCLFYYWVLLSNVYKSDKVVIIQYNLFATFVKQFFFLVYNLRVYKIVKILIIKLFCNFC